MPLLPCRQYANSGERTFRFITSGGMAKSGSSCGFCGDGGVRSLLRTAALGRTIAAVADVLTGLGQACSAMPLFGIQTIDSQSINRHKPMGFSDLRSNLNLLSFRPNNTGSAGAPLVLFGYFFCAQAFSSAELHWLT